MEKSSSPVETVDMVEKQNEADATPCKFPPLPVQIKVSYGTCPQHAKD